ncbi:hypothetical protein GC093_11085 [Paenibacillus sp. LMG 31456]|uniref:Uncharacterized protein n=1 Tax=Paenibacillus foliorum TaxID=2654974 RepID=A0A972GN65_9BACL|nr:hypothetical protein [Paenibacillus foliorum]NOU93762.1 hypothetical protein [Paenibacillus foliorum]
MLQWIVAESEKAAEDGVRFLCRYAEDLGVPYKWSTVLQSIYTAIYDKGFMVGLDRSGQVRGGLAYTYGYGEDGSEDRTRIEVQLIYLEAGFRGGKALLEAIAALVERELELFDLIGKIEIYCTPTDGHRRLLGKFATLCSTEMYPCGMLSLYVTTPERLSQYVIRYTSRNKQENSAHLR